MLIRAIAAAEQDPARLRSMVYKLARMTVRSKLSQRSPAESSSKELVRVEMTEQMLALERAIGQIESELVDDTKFLDFFSEDVSDRAPGSKSPSQDLVVRQEPGQPALEGDILSPVAPLSPIFAAKSEFFPVRKNGSIRPILKSAIGFAAVAALGVVLYSVALNRAFFAPGNPHAPDQNVTTAAISGGLPQVAPKPSLPAGFPMPTAYGVYAVNHNKLVGLQSLPIRVPDQRVAISALISTPSETSLPDGQLQFVIFRRDLVNSAPDTAVVRVVARVMRALTFDGAGKPKIVNVDGSWAVRSKAYEMKVAPVGGNPEMVIISPPNSDYSFPAGRYALVLKTLAYDFSVDGPVTDAVQCLERTDAVNTPVYSECRIP